MHVIRLHWSFYECLNVYSQSCSNSHFSHANYTCTCILCAFILTCISLNKNKSSKNYFKFSIHIHVPHFVNNVKHLIYPYFWQHCWQPDESPPNSFLLLPRHHKSIGTHKFKFETIRNSEPFKVFNISFFLHLYSIKSVDIRIKPSLCTLWIRTVPHKPLLPAVLSDEVKAQSSPTTTMLTLSPSAFALSAARPKLSLSPV